MTRRRPLAPLLAALALIAACHTSSAAPPRVDVEAVGTSVGRMPRAAMAQLQPTEGQQVHGTVRFTTEPDGLRVRVHVSLAGLSPGEHGFHIHEFGDCSARDASSAGDDYSPTHAPHSARESAVRHLGDLGNVAADEAGVVDESFVDPLLSIAGPHSILGRAVVVHLQRDDLVTQPHGDAGGAAACGVIEPVF